MIQSWADAFRGQSDLQGVVQMYNELKSKGIEFPATDLDSMAPILTPQRSVSTPQRTLSSSPPLNQPINQSPRQVIVTPLQLSPGIIFFIIPVFFKKL